MKTTTCKAALLAFCSFAIANSHAQELNTFNQNASRSNHTRSLATDAWTFAFNAGTSFAANSNERTLFRGNSFASKLSGHYYFDRIGLGISSGIIPGSISDNALNSFIAKRKFPQDQLQITKSKPFNSYLLAGPSVRFGNRVSVLADIQGGLFVNDPGAVIIMQSGVTRALYRFEGGDKKIFPGFSGSISIAYPVSNTTQFFINTDYLQSRSAIRIQDPGSGIDVATQLNRDVKLLTAGIGIIKTFGINESSAIAKKRPGNVKYNDITMQQGKTGMTRRELPGNSNTAAMGEPSTSGLVSNQSCGPVTQRILNPDGSTQEMTFSCLADAAAYANRISMNVTVPKQTQGATFGEKVNQGLHAAGSALAQGASKEIIHRDLAARNILTGRLSWLIPDNSEGIVTNKSVSAVSSLAGGGGGAASASYARQTNSSSFGTMVRLYAREASSGMATGRNKNAKEQNTGMSTGRRIYEPVFNDNSGPVCSDCLANVKSNPMYKDKGMEGNNPLYSGRSAADDGEGIGQIDIQLIDVNSRAVMAQTKTESTGDFFFANVPDGMYTVRLSGVVESKKGYDIITTSSTDVLGTVNMGSPAVQLYINTGEVADAPTQKAGISTSRSNIRSKSLTIVEADLDGDGEFESFRATGTFSDGSSDNIDAVARNANGKKTIVLEGETLQKMRRRVEVLKSNKNGDPDANRIVSITVSGNGNNITASAAYKDGHTEDVTAQVIMNTAGNGVRQYTIAVADMNDDGLADAVIAKATSNEMNASVSGRKMIPVTVSDITGAQKTVAAPFVPGGSVVTAAMRPGAPIKGVIVKGGKNPGGNLRSLETNENGEFEFADLEAGDYTITVEQNFVIDDETTVVMESETRAQDHNSSRSNKTASTISVDPANGTANKNNVGPLKWMAPESLKSIVVTADLDGDGVYETDVTAKISDEIKLDDKGEVVAPQQKAGVSTSRSNIRSRSSLQSIGEKLHVGYGTAEINNKTVPVKIIYIEKATSGLKDTLKTQV